LPNGREFVIALDPMTTMRPVCPRCGMAVIRIPRRPLGRWLSLIRPVRRYRCPNIACGWEGNLRSAPPPDLAAK